MALTLDAVRFRAVLIGEERRLTLAAFSAAVLLVLLSATVEYTWMSQCVQAEASCHASDYVLFRVSNMLEVGPPLWLYDELLVVALAWTHAYFNLGYVPSLLLASAPQVGGLLVWIGGDVTDPAVELHLGKIVTSFPSEVLLLASLGFLAAVAARVLSHQIRSGTASR